MKSKMTHTTVARCLALGALGISMATGIGCHCKSRSWNSVCARHPSGVDQHVSTTRATSSSENNLSDSNSESPDGSSNERSGLLINFRKAVTRNQAHAKTEKLVESSAASETSAQSNEQEVSTERVAVTEMVAKSSRRSLITQAKPAGKTSQPKEAAESIIISASGAAVPEVAENQPTSVESVAKTPPAAQEIDLIKSPRANPFEPQVDKPSLNSTEMSSLTPLLKPVARFEPTSVDAVTKTQPAMQEIDLSSSSGAMQLDANANELEQTAANTTAKPGQQPTMLPRTSAILNRQVDTKSSTSESTSHLAAVAENPSQPLALELRDGAWPIYGEVDPVARAFEAHKKSKSQFRNLESQPWSQPNGSANTPMQMVGHRRRVTESAILDEKAMLHDRTNWVQIETPTKQNTGLQLSATPRSANVPISPVVQLKQSSSNPPARDAQQIPLKMEPGDWPIELDSHERLPLDDIGPIFDLPVSESIRRMSIRPESNREAETIER